MLPRVANPNARTRREYSLKTSQRVTYLALAAVFVGGAIAISSSGVDSFALTMAVLLAIPGVILGLGALRSKLILEGDRLELRSALRTRTVRRDDIDGLQRIRNRYGTSTRIFLKAHRGAVSVSGAFTGNAHLEEWLKGLPDVDERNAAQIEKMIDSQSSTGIGSQAHEEVLEKASTWMIRLGMAGGVACAAAAVPYRPIYSLGAATLLILPLVAVFLLHRFPLLFTTFKARVDPRADLTLLIALPGIGIIVSAMVESDPSHLVDPASLMPWFGLIFVAFFASLAGIAWKSPARWGGLVALTIFGVAYSVGLVDAADTMPDDSIPSFFRTWIVKKYERHGRSTTFYLRLAPWGPIHGPSGVSVRRSTYQRSAEGDPVCVASHRGFLHGAWYELVPCAGMLVRQAALSVPQTARDASAILADAQRDAAQRPHDAHAQFVLGECLVQLERYDEALPPLLVAERLDSSDAWNRGVIGWVLNKQGRFAEAVPHLLAAVALDSTYGEAQHNLAWSYLKLNDLNNAERTYDVVVRLEPKSGQAALEYASVLERQQATRAADEQIARALRLEPNNGRIEAYAGYLFRREAHFADARQHYEAASRLLPNDPAVWAELAATDYLMNDRVAAAASFTESVRLDSSYVTSRPNLLQMWRDVAQGNGR